MTGDGRPLNRRRSPVVRRPSLDMLRAIVVILGIVLAAAGGVIAYRALFVDPSAAVLLTNESVRHLPNTLNVLEGIVLLTVGAGIAFAAAVREPRR